jgi:hypothetical protein
MPAPGWMPVTITLPGSRVMVQLMKASLAGWAGSLPWLERRIAELDISATPATGEDRTA